MPNLPPVPMAWPADLFAPATPAEARSAVYAVHEASHAIVAVDFGYTVDLIDITLAATEAEIAARGWKQGILIAEVLRDEPAAVMIAAARPAVTLYLHLIGKGRQPAAVEENCRTDDEQLRHMCELQPELEPWVRNTAERWVVAQWPRIVDLARTLITARGRLPRPRIAAAPTQPPV